MGKGVQDNCAKIFVVRDPLYLLQCTLKYTRFIQQISCFNLYPENSSVDGFTMTLRIGVGNGLAVCLPAEMLGLKAEYANNDSTLF